MKSTTGVHYVGLDYVRAFAAYLVVSWHLMHEARGIPVPFEGAPSFPLFSLMDEGHAGVSLFMVLSGYLFAKLLDGKNIHYGAFLYNRLLRLAPLLIVVMGLVGVKKFVAQESISDYLLELLTGFYLMTWPNGGWSVSVEIHFYLMLPFLLWAGRQWRIFPIFALGLALMLRAYILWETGDIKYLSYGTIVGRIDQFLMGLAIWGYRRELLSKKPLLMACMATYLAFQWWFNQRGGAFRSPNDFTNQIVWLIMPLAEAVAFGSFVVWFDSKQWSPGRWAKQLLAKIGEYSYSIYLLHAFFVYKFVNLIDQKIMVVDNVYVACLWSGVFMVCMLPIGYLSYRFIEEPFLRYRKKYTY